MRALLRNNIFTNPGGWAEKTVGTIWRYRAMQLGTVALSIALFAMYLAVSRPLEWHQQVAVGVCIAVGTLVLPLCYLRALRHL